MIWKPSKRNVLLGLAALPAAGAFARTARAEIEVNVNRGDIQPLPIAIPAFTGGQAGDIASVVAADLQRSGLFRPLDPAIFRAAPPQVGNVPDSFDPWKAIGAQALVIGRVSTGADGRLVVDSELFDVYAAAPFRNLPREFYGERISVNFNAREACSG